MEWIMGVPAVVKIMCLFGAIVALYRLRVPLWADVLAVSCAAGLWFGSGLEKMLHVAGGTAVGEETLFLAVVVLLIQGLGHALNGTGALKRIVGAVSDLLGKSMYSAAALPALIGLLPMPGGAVFSAPMVETACVGCDEISAEQKAAINHWFRHIWEYWWPMYPGVILASQLFKTTMWTMVWLHLPFTLAAVAGGYFFILRRAFPKGTGDGKQGGGTGTFRKALTESAPIVVVVATIFIVGPVLSRFGLSGISANYWPVIAGVVLGFGWLAVDKKLSPGQVMRFMVARDQVSMVMIVVSTLVFRDMLVGVNAFSAVRNDLELYHVPWQLVVVALPFISGMVMGLTIGYVGGSFPLVISLLPAAVMGSDVRLAYLALAYSFGYMGMLLSPVHLCLILTKDYFKADFVGIYRRLLPPALCVLGAGVVMFFVYLRVLG